MIGRREEGPLAIVAALGDVEVVARRSESRFSGHSEILSGSPGIGISAENLVGTVLNGFEEARGRW